MKYFVLFNFRVPKSSTCRKIDFEDEEERRIKEGAETLLNLAGITTRKRNNSQTYEVEPKRLRLQKHPQQVQEVQYAKPTQFRPRLLRKKSKKVSNNNKIVQTDDEWVKHRRELEINDSR